LAFSRRDILCSLDIGASVGNGCGISQIASSTRFAGGEWEVGEYGYGDFVYEEGIYEGLSANKNSRMRKMARNANEASGRRLIGLGLDTLCALKRLASSMVGESRSNREREGERAPLLVMEDVLESGEVKKPHLAGWRGR
jgi:hypothetical protein